MIFDELENVKPEPKRRSIKFKCKRIVKKPTRRSTRHTVRKDYAEEDVPDDDHYICKFSIILHGIIYKQLLSPTLPKQRNKQFINSTVRMFS